MQWTLQQDSAIKAASRWFKDRSAPQVFRLYGYAGTGKSTIANVLAQDARNVLYGAFTGKAALVMRQKGCPGATTIHSMIYKPKENAFGEIVFELNEDSLVADSDLVVIDEASMVNGDLGGDLLSFGTKVLVLMDPEQLPPVSGAGFFMTDTPEVMLTDITRQALDNPIVRLSMIVREGGRLEYGQYGESLVMPRKELRQGRVLEADQVLCGLNRTRHQFNHKIRALYGCQSPDPVVGDKLLCLRNDKERGLLNGSQWEIQSLDVTEGDVLGMTVLTRDGIEDVEGVEIRVPRQFFTGEEGKIDKMLRRKMDEFCYGYAMTVHKSQGSQWNNVMVFDESGAFREDARRHLYTAITRAADRVTIVQG